TADSDRRRRPRSRDEARRLRPRAVVPSTAMFVRLERIAQTCDFLLDPCFDLGHESLHVLALRADGRPDRDCHSAGSFPKYTLGPQIAGIMRHWNDRNRERERKPGSPALIVGARPHG